jgi:hypothetical protein
MFTMHYDRFLPVACAGFGLFLVGAAWLLLLRRGVVAKVVAVLLAFGAAFGAAAALGPAELPPPTARWFALGLFPFVLLASRRFTAGVAAVVAAARRPAVSSVLLATLGLGLVVGSLAAIEYADEHSADDALAEIELMQGQTPTVDTGRARATSDKGTPIALREPAQEPNPVLGTAEARILTNAQLNDQIIRRGPAGDHTNCHGWVFTGGKFRVTGEDVELILRENGYQEVHQPQVGDLVIYRQGGVVSHTALVRYVAEGQPVLVESKWGNLGLFLHPADRSIYGTDYAFHRSPRNGHLLVGLGGNPAATGSRPVVAEE